MAERDKFEEEGEEMPEDLEKIMGLRYTTCYCGVALMYALIFVLMLISTLHQYWARIGPEDDAHLYGLFRLNEGPMNAKYTTWNCVKKVACSNPDEEGLCNTGTDLHAAGSTFFAIELFAYLCALFTVERFVYLARERGVAWEWTIYLLASMTFVTQITATVAWFGISGADYEVNCDNPPDDRTQTWDVCADDGSKIAIAVTVLTGLAGICACVGFKSRPLGSNWADDTGSVRFICMPVNWVMALVLLPMLANLALLIVSLIVSEWSKTNDVTGSLWYYSNWLDYSTYGFDCIAYPNCHLDPDSGICKTFRDLSDAGLAYMSLEIAALFMWAWWLQPTIHLVAGKEYGYSFLNYLSGAMSFLFHFFATIIWFGVSQADFDLTCDKEEFDPRKKWSICALTGAQIAVANTAVYCVSYPLWAWVYYNRQGKAADGQAEIPAEQADPQQGVQLT